MYRNLRKSLTRTTATALIAGLLVSTTTLSGALAAPGVDTPNKSEEPYDIVILGDSLAVGYELGFTEKSIPYGFGEHVYEQALFNGYRAEYSNYGILGLRSDGLNNWISAASTGKSVTDADIQPNIPDPRVKTIVAKTKQLEADLKEAELILLSIGANDFLQLVGMMNLNTEFSGLPQTKQDELKSTLATLLDTFSIELEETLTAIHKLQPNAEVVISNQYLPIPSLILKEKVTYLIPDSTALFLLDVQDQLLKKLEGVIAKLTSKGLTIKIADSATGIEKNVMTNTSIGAKDSEGNSKPDSHPTAAGYAVMGKAYTEALWGDYKTVQPRKSNVPISVVVEGKEIITTYSPIIKKGRTFIAIADITDALGATRSWNGSTNTATIKLGGRTVEITIGAKTIKVNGESLPLNAEPAYLQQFTGEKKTYVPLAALSEGLGLQVTYRDTIKTAFINN
ncbi:hypothetical protein I6N90_15060 [Paenibacillus sp. GSMTC-2017]|uniref:stalk domain-containing protein n=1 Tax=Paenibacillus sp. GSMTC-2017 TaxID=2794350 RepID=UPI0018D81EA6|nr:stalk domain-containing protein [Paenibacillus sp. GSMTC-2017]MBH5319125.1 hypothetical protein [Paenibacillus sp. GSMTC-2017]